MKLPTKKQLKGFLLLCITFFGILAFPLFNLQITQVNAATNPSFVSASGTKLYLNGQVYQFTGINAYELTTLPGVTAGCGGIIPNLDSFFSSLRPNSAVRMWAFQGSVATNVTTKKLDWTQLDRVINAATAHNQKLVLVLSPQSGQCDDGHWKDRAWYSGGYNQSFNDDGKGLAPLPFIEYAKAVANRYKDSPTIAMYELVSEPEAADCRAGYTGEACYSRQICSNETLARDALRSFYDTVGGQMKKLDSNHLIQSGVMGNGQCGAVYENYKYIHQSPGIDVASYHDYGMENEPMPGDIYNGLQKRLDQMKLVGKPLVVGEVGMRAHSIVGKCDTLNDRYRKMKAKMDAQFAAGIAGFIPWDWVHDNQGICTYDINPGDPLLALLHDYPVSMPLPATNPNITPIVRPTSIPLSQQASTKLGGIDVSRYCYSLKFSSAILDNNSWKCGGNDTKPNMTLACQSQYTNMTYAKQDIPGNPYSWNCYLPPGIKLGL